MWGGGEGLREKELFCGFPKKEAYITSTWPYLTTDYPMINAVLQDRTGSRAGLAVRGGRERTLRDGVGPRACRTLHHGRRQAFILFLYKMQCFGTFFKAFIRFSPFKLVWSATVIDRRLAESLYHGRRHAPILSSVKSSVLVSNPYFFRVFIHSFFPLQISRIRGRYGPQTSQNYPSWTQENIYTFPLQNAVFWYRIRTF